MICLLSLMAGMIGVFVSLDLFLFYVFWEVMLIPMYLLIGVWGNPARRVYAAIKFFLFTMFGSLLMLVAILVLYFHYGKTTGTYTFDLLKLYSVSIPFNMQFWMFLAFGLAFAIKVPMFPFHTWLPDAHTEAPTVGSVILAAVLLKMGTYGFLRFNMPLFPEAAHYFVPLFCILAVIGIVYGALVSMVQKDLKRLIAFSSVSHLGFVMLGLFTFTMPGVQGGIIQMINHGLSTGALFLDRRHDLRAAPHPADLRVRRPVHRHAHLCHHLHDRHPVLHRAAGVERLRGRVSHPPRGLPGQQALCHHRRHRRHLRRLLHAVDVPAGDVRQGDQRKEPGPEGPVLAGNRHLCAAPDPVHRLDRGLSQHLFETKPRHRRRTSWP